jgi:hypothetical protein
MVKSRFARWAIVALYGAVLMAALFAAIILFYDTHYRVARVVEKRPEFFVALGFGFFLSRGVRHRLYARRKLTRWSTAWWALVALVPIAAALYATGFVRVSTAELSSVAVFLVLGFELGLLGAVSELMGDRGRIAPVRTRRFEGRRGSLGWGALFAAAITTFMALGLVLAGLLEGGWAAHRGQVLIAAMLLSMTAGFLAVRLFFERSRIETSGFRLAAGTLLFILLLSIYVVVVDGRHDGATGKLLAIAAGIGAMSTASTTWLWGLRFRWLGLAGDDDHGRSESLRELQRLTARIRRDPQDSNALAERSKILLARGEVSRALDDLDKARQLNQENAHHFLYLRYLVRMSQGDFAQALQDILSAIEVDETRREDYYVAAAIAYVRLGRIDGVIAMLEKQGMPASRAFAVQSSAFNAALSDIDREIASRTSMMSERYGSDERPRLDFLRQIRTEILVKLMTPGAAPSDVESGR